MKRYVVRVRRIGNHCDRSYFTDVLFPKVGFVIGMGLLGNLFGNYFVLNMSDSGEEADKKAQLSDWGVIGDDVRTVYWSSKSAKS